MASKTGTCRQCGQTIRFIRTGAKWMPCDPEEKQGYQVEEKVLITGDGVVKKPCNGLEVGFAPHWTTCAGAASFRADLARKRAQRNEREEGANGR